MDYRERWHPIKQRLTELKQMIEVLDKLEVAYPAGALKFGLGDEIVGCAIELGQFASEVESAGFLGTGVAAQAHVTIQTILGKLGGNFPVGSMWELIMRMHAWGGHFEAEVLRGSQEIGVLVEASLGALEARLATESSYLADWQAAYNQTRGEDAVERMGGALLRQRDIWAVKMQSGNQITDLVLQEPPREDKIGQARGLILTEWKHVSLKPIANQRGDLPGQLNEQHDVQPSYLDTADTNNDSLARWRVSAGWRKSLREAVLDAIRESEVQSWAYQGGVLQGALLQKIRYLFIVCPDSVVLPPYEHKTSDGTIVRVRVIDVSSVPMRPSALSRAVFASTSPILEQDIRAALG